MPTILNEINQYITYNSPEARNELEQLIREKRAVVASDETVEAITKHKDLNIKTEIKLNDIIKNDVQFNKKLTEMSLPLKLLLTSTVISFNSHADLLLFIENTEPFMAEPYIFDSTDQKQIRINHEHYWGCNY